MILREVELYDNGDLEKTAGFFRDTIGLAPMNENHYLKVFGTGWPHIDFNISKHHPDFNVSLSFLVKNLEATRNNLFEKGGTPGEIRDSHLGMKAFDVIAPGNIRLVFQMATEASPGWLKDML